MPTLTHPYPVTVSWSGARDGSGDLTFDTSGQTFPLAVAPELGGTGMGANPEEMLTGAIAACYSITFGIVSGVRKLPITGLTVEAVGEVEQSGQSLTFKKIVIKPAISVAEGTTEAQIEQVVDIAHKAEKYCVITNAVRDKVEVVVEPKVIPNA